jgi:hypothetical protein
MEKYIATIESGRTNIYKHAKHGVYHPSNIAELLDLLNTPPTPTPSTGIQWRKPGELGRVDGKFYLVWRTHTSGNYQVVYEWSAKWAYDGWDINGVEAWAELPAPPAWEGEKA